MHSFIPDTLVHIPCLVEIRTLPLNGITGENTFVDQLAYRENDVISLKQPILRPIVSKL